MICFEILTGTYQNAIERIRMTSSIHLSLSRRELEIVNILYRIGEASVSETLDAMQSPPGYSAVRAMLGLLEKKGIIRHRQIGKKYLFSPVEPKEKARCHVLYRVLEKFFDNSREEFVVSLLDLDCIQLKDEDFDRLTKVVEEKRRGQRKKDTQAPLFSEPQE
jgi:predicted transcriptional regulator